MKDFHLSFKAHNRNINTLITFLNDGIAEEVKVSETYSTAARSALLSLLPAQFSSEDLNTTALKIAKSVRTVQRQIRRAIGSGQVRELGKGSYQKK